MKAHQLFEKFNNALKWNAFDYIGYKLLYVSTTFLFYRIFSTEDFSLWATSNSILFLILLWIDCGLRKAIPFFIPKLMHDEKSRKKFIASIIIFKISTLLVALPFFAKLWHWRLPTATSHPQYKLIFFCTLYNFFCFGIISIMRLLYHAHFWNKQFNYMQTLANALEMCFCLFLCFYLPNNSLLGAVFVLKLIFSTLIVIFSVWILVVRTKNDHLSFSENAPIHFSRKDFIKFSSFMWGTSIVASLSERNFLFPLFTSMLGPAQANIFKVANDSALLFYRCVIKTIGTSDITLLSHSQTMTNCPLALSQVTSKLSRTIALMCIPTLTALATAFMIKYFYSTPDTTMYIIILMTLTYLAESLLSPYERILETTYNYKKLALSYSPQILLLGLFFAFPTIKFFGIFLSIFAIQIIRLATCLLHYYFAQKFFNFHPALKTSLKQEALTHEQPAILSEINAKTKNPSEGSR